MLTVKRTVYGLELYRQLMGGREERLATCDNVGKVENLVVWLTALDSLVGLDKVLIAKQAQQVAAPQPKETNETKTTAVS